MKNHRIYVEKYARFQVEAESLRKELNENLGLAIAELRVLNVYDLFGFSDELVERCRYSVFGEIVTDCVSDECDYESKRYLAIEYLPGQFDQRASSAVDCVHLLEPAAEVKIRSSRLYIFDDGVSEEQMAKIRHYLINAVESREKDLTVLSDAEQADIKPVPVLEGFTDMQEEDLLPYCKENGLAMNADDLRCVVEYFRSEHRNPTQTELRILDTYWSDHCRHTTFTTEIETVEIDESFMRNEYETALAEFGVMRKELGREQKSLCLMELATIGGRYLRKIGKLDDMEVSEENNACSIFVDVDIEGQKEKWLLQFKNETHNHPTEIEPFGGASTCLGGAIRDPLSGRAYVYQAMRVTGAGDIYKGIDETIEGKLPQRIISRKAAAGYSSYGNQIGLATTHVREIYHDDYVAKRLEVGAVVGAVKAADVRRESPAPGDVVLLLGGRTGRDGIGGATGSSKQHTTASLEECGSEVQKGNAPEERKIQHLFRRGDVTRLIKKSNDFGAGGVSVAIGELTDGLDIYLDRVPVKYNGLNATELAISESQERMSVVVEKKDVEAMVALCHEENVEVTHVADVTDTRRMRMFYKGEKVADLKREFIDSAGAPHYTKITLGAIEQRNPFHREVEGATLREKVLNNLKDNNVVSQRGLCEMFDSTIGRSTVLMPFGGKTQRTETQVSMQTLPVRHGKTSTASVMAFGFNPYISAWSPYHGAEYTVVEAIAKVVASGASYENMRFSYQEYFERMTDARSWGKPMSALLGTIRMQKAFELPSIGGKDSMSGTFQDINVPPTLIAFGITTLDARKAVSPEFKAAGNGLYLVKHNPNEDWTPNTEELKQNFKAVTAEVEKGNILSAYAIGFGGVAEAVAKMSFGNEIGATLTCDEATLFDYSYGSILVEAKEAFEGAVKVGETTTEKSIVLAGESFSLEELYEANTVKFEKIYPAKGKSGEKCRESNHTAAAPTYKGEKVDKVQVYLPVFPGTNCDYDTARAFEREGAETHIGVFRNLTPEDVLQSIEAMAEAINKSHILVLSGGFSLGDEPDGSGKFIASVLNNATVTAAVHALIERGGLILGICNGFQALVKSGLLPYGRLGMMTTESPTLFHNDIHRHISQIVSTRVGTTASPWLSSFEVGDLHSIAVSHGEGKFVVSEEMAEELFANGQVAFQYADMEGNATTDAPHNPNGSSYGIEGIISKNGQILGKMGHTERYDDYLFKNIAGEKRQNIFANAVAYFTK